MHILPLGLLHTQLIRADGSYADGKRYYYQFVNQLGSNFVLR